MGSPTAALRARRASRIAEASVTERCRLFERATSMTSTSLLRRTPTSSRAGPSLTARSWARTSAAWHGPRPRRPGRPRGAELRPGCGRPAPGCTTAEPGRRRGAQRPRGLSSCRRRVGRDDRRVSLPHLRWIDPQGLDQAGQRLLELAARDDLVDETVIELEL